MAELLIQFERVKTAFGVKVLYLYSRGGARHPENSFRLQPCLLQLRQQLQTNTQIHRTVMLMIVSQSSLFTQSTKRMASAYSSVICLACDSLPASCYTPLTLFRDNAVYCVSFCSIPLLLRTDRSCFISPMISQSDSKTLAQIVKPKLKTQKTQAFCSSLLSSVQFYSVPNRMSPCNAEYQT